MTNDSAHYTIPREPGRIEAVILAVLMHAVLFAFLWIGINWVSQTPQSIDPDYVVTQQELDTPQPQPEPVPVPTP
ncbi:MAG TPA: protein TolA, partial [Burkholderiaceae bacterium]